MFNVDVVNWLGNHKQQATAENDRPTRG